MRARSRSSWGYQSILLLQVFRLYRISYIKGPWISTKKGATDLNPSQRLNDRVRALRSLSAQPGMNNVPPWLRNSRGRYRWWCSWEIPPFFCILQSILNGCLLGMRNFLHEKAVHWYCTNKPPLRIWRAYFDSPLPFWYNLLLIVTSKLWGRWTLEFSKNNFAAYFYWQLHIRYRFSYNKSSCISPTKQKEPLTWVEVSGKTKALTQSGNHYKKSLTFP